MKPTREQIRNALHIAWHTRKNKTFGDAMDSATDEIMSLLEAQPVDIESLKRKLVHPDRIDLGNREMNIDRNKEARIWNDCIDHLAATGRLAGVNLEDNKPCCETCQDRGFTVGFSNTHIDCKDCPKPAPDRDVRDALDWVCNAEESLERGVPPHNVLATIRKALTRPAVPEGYALVPIDLSDEFIFKAAAQLSDVPVSQSDFDDVREWHGTVISISKAMLTAAPKQEGDV